MDLHVGLNVGVVSSMQRAPYMVIKFCLDLVRLARASDINVFVVASMVDRAQISVFHADVPGFGFGSFGVFVLDGFQTFGAFGAFAESCLFLGGLRL